MKSPCAKMSELKGNFGAAWVPRNCWQVRLFLPNSFIQKYNDNFLLD